MEIGPSGDPTGPKLPDPVGLSPIPEETLGSGHKWSNSDHHNIMTGSDHFGFLIYVSWKMMGWVLVMVGVLLALRCLRMWLLSAWIRETGLDQHRLDFWDTFMEAAGYSTTNASGRLAGSNGLDAEAGLEEASTASNGHLTTYNETSVARSNSNLSDSPPKYEDVVTAADSAAAVSLSPAINQSDCSCKSGPSRDEDCCSGSVECSATSGGRAGNQQSTTIEEDPPSYSELFKPV